MDYDRDFVVSRTDATLLGTSGFGTLRIALLFGSAAVALAIVLVPIMQRTASGRIAAAEATDPIVTGGTSKERSRYSIRRSVLSDRPDEPCVIYADGSNTGTC